MSAPNPELVIALQEASGTENYKQRWEEAIKELSDNILNDQFSIRVASYSRSTYTVAALLCKDDTLRSMAVSQGIEVRQFDNIIGQVQQLILTKTTRAPNGAKVAAVLKRLAGI